MCREGRGLGLCLRACAGRRRTADGPRRRLRPPRRRHGAHPPHNRPPARCLAQRCAVDASATPAFCPPLRQRQPRHAPQADPVPRRLPVATSPRAPPHWLGARAAVPRACSPGACASPSVSRDGRRHPPRGRPGADRSPGRGHSTPRSEAVDGQNSESDGSHEPRGRARALSEPRPHVDRRRIVGISSSEAPLVAANQDTWPDVCRCVKNPFPGGCGSSATELVPLRHVLRYHVHLLQSSRLAGVLLPQARTTVPAGPGLRVSTYAITRAAGPPPGREPAPPVAAQQAPAPADRRSAAGASPYHLRRRPSCSGPAGMPVHQCLRGRSPSGPLAACPSHPSGTPRYLPSDLGRRAFQGAGSRTLPPSAPGAFLDGAGCDSDHGAGSQALLLRVNDTGRGTTVAGIRF